VSAYDKYQKCIAEFSVFIVGDGAGNTVEENFSMFSLIRMH